MLRVLIFLLASASLHAADRPADRDVAEWVLKQRGHVTVNGTLVRELSKLPAGDLKLTGIDLTGTLIDAKELERLSNLKSLTDLYLPAASFNPGAGSTLNANDELRYLSGLPALRRLHFSLHCLT